MDRVFRHDQRKVEEHLLAFPGGDTVLFPILREVGLIPIEPFKPEQSLHARPSLYMATIYRWALPRQRLPLNDPPELIRSNSFVLDSAAYDLVEIMQRKHPRIYDRAFGNDPAFWTDASPYRRLTVAPAPMLLVCSTKRSDACPPAQTFASKVTELGGKVIVLPVDMKHGELNKELGLLSDYTTTIEGFMRTLGLP